MHRFLVVLAIHTAALSSFAAPQPNETSLGRWKTAAPADAEPRGAWWLLFDDAALNGLEDRALTANQDLRAAVARVEQARATAGIAQADYWPSLAAGASVDHGRTSSTVDNPLRNLSATTYRAPAFLAWEIDLFGRVRHQHASAVAEAESAAALLESVRLALSAEVAANYFSLRASDREIAVVRSTLDLRRDASRLVQARFNRGSAAEVDVARADTELATVEAELIALRQRRATLQNALAVLVGEPATEFMVDPSSSELSSPPVLAPNLPSDLLERRPDVAAAERSLAAAAARIGVAKAAFFPAISLTGAAGFASGEVNDLFRWDSRAWSIGPSVYLPIFQGGRLRSNLERTRAAYDEAVATYQQRLLVAFRELQDTLAATQFLSEQADVQNRAIASARRGADLSQIRYDAGLVSYLEVVDAQRTALLVERTGVQLAGQRLMTTVALIKALGGGWSDEPRPTAD